MPLSPISQQAQDWCIPPETVKAIASDDGSAPKSVVKYAKRLLEESEKTEGDNAYDRVYCVIDKDNHSTYQESLSMIKGNKKLYGIASVPCFEFWILIHFKHTTKPMDADRVIREIKKNIPDFDKEKTCYGELYLKQPKGLTQSAIHHSKMIAKETNTVKTDNPSTQIHELLEYLLQEISLPSRILP